MNLLCISNRWIDKVIFKQHEFDYIEIIFHVDYSWYRLGLEKTLAIKS